MQRRKRGVARTVQPVRPDSRGNGSPGPSRAPSVGTAISTLALSSRSRTTAVKRYATSASGEVLLPYTLFEFGFDSPRTTALPPSAQFSDPGGEEFMASPAGSQLRAMERRYSRIVRQFIARSVRLGGADLLVLGSGSSKEIIPLLSRGVHRVTFVDTNPAALARMWSNLQEVGLTAVVEVELVEQDAWDFLSLSGPEEYDVVLATKCVGLILGANPASRSVPGLTDMVSDVLRPDGSFFCDHHLAFSRPGLFPQRVADVVRPELRDLATIGGRYDQDVCYSMSGPHAGFDAIATIASPRAPHLVQAWQFFHFRVAHRLPSNRRVVLSPHRPVAPVEIRAPVVAAFDPDADAMMPVNARGVKRVVSASDVRGHEIGTARPKFDGRPGIVSMAGREAVFISPNSSFGLPLCCQVEPPLVLTAELVASSDTAAVVVVTGLVAAGQTRADPLAYEPLRSVGRVIESLGPSGFLLSTPELVRSVRRNAVVLPGPGGVEVSLPVDGVQLSLGSRDGVFVKPRPLCSVDLVPSTALSTLTAAYDACGVEAGPPTVDREDGDGVHEYFPGPGLRSWRRGRRRVDKLRPDTIGAVAHTVFCAASSDEYRMGATVEDVLTNIAR